MPDINADEIILQQHVRNYIQFGGPGPGNAVLYAGMDAQYISIEGVSVPDGAGALEPVYVPDPRRPSQYKLVGRKASPPDLAQASLVMLERHGAIPRQLQRIGCAFNLYEAIGPCKDLSDFLHGWSDYVLVYSQAKVNGPKNLGNRSAFDSDDRLADTLPVALADVYPVGALSFGDNAASLITLEAIDVVYGSREQCGECGPADDGTGRLYAVTESSGSTPGTAPEVVYSVNGGATWAEGTIDGLGDTEDPVAIDVVGPYLVVVTRIAGGPTLGGYYYSLINADTGVPGTWTKVTSGFVASAQPNDIFVLSPREVFIVGDGGYVYKATDITAGVTAIHPGTATTSNLQRIHGDGAENIVAVGAAGTVLVSTNRGATWNTAAASPVAATLQALSVNGSDVWWVGTAGGQLYYTLNGGASWTEKTFSGSSAGQVRDIVFATAEAGFISHDTATPTARIFATWDGGRTWTNAAPRITNLPTYDRGNRIAVPDAHASIAANNVAVAGLGGNGSDGILLLGIASRL